MSIYIIVVIMLSMPKHLLPKLRPFDKLKLTGLCHDAQRTPISLKYTNVPKSIKLKGVLTSFFTNFPTSPNHIIKKAAKKRLTRYNNRLKKLHTING